MTISKNILPGSGAVDAHEIEQSLMFTQVNDYLKRTPSSVGNRKTFTLSYWAKVGTIDGTSRVILTAGTSNSDVFHHNFESGGTPDDALRVVYYAGGAFQINLTTNRLFRDTASWYHIVLAIDTTQGVAANRVKMYVNGEQETSFATSVYPSLNLDLNVNTATAHWIGQYHSADFALKSYLAEMNFVDGAAKTPADFAETNSGTGQWIPKEYKGSYGTNGFYLPFKKATDGYSVNFRNLLSYDSSLTFPLSPGANFYLDGDFTIECWVKMADYTARGGVNPNILIMGITQLYVNQDGSYGLHHSGDKCTAAGFPLHQWNHVAVTRDGSLCQLYLNGVRTAATYHTITFGTNTGTGRIGAYTETIGEINGNISNLRVVKGTAVYTGGSCTVPTANLTNVTNTKLLCCQGSTTTSKVVGPALTAVGNPVVALNSPYATYGGFDRDASGQDSHFSSANLANHDVVPDSPTNNFCTWDTSASSPNNTFTGGNLQYSSGATWDLQYATMGASTGKWYWEMKTSGGIQYFHPGFGSDEIFNDNPGSYGGHQAWSWSYYGGTGRMYNAGAIYGEALTAMPTGGAFIGLALDLDNQKAWYSLNGVWMGTGANPSTGAGPNITNLTAGRDYYPLSDTYNLTCRTNFGQNGTFHGENISGGNADANGIGDFRYPPPTGFLSLCTKNLPEPSDVALAPKEHFNTVLYSGTTTTTKNVTGVGFQPDFVWLKRRDAAAHHSLQDSVRGPNKTVSSSTTNAQGSDSGAGLSAFTSDGFTVIEHASAQGVTNSGNMVAWNWKAGGTAPVKTYTVKVVSDSGNKYRFDDFAASAQTVEMQEGGTYTFDQSDSSNSNHPFRFSTTSNGSHASGSEYTTGVVTSGTPGSSGAKTVITIAASSPTLYYYCTNHSGMGGQANTNSTYGSSYFDGALKSKVSANQAAGFSIVTWLSDNSNAGGVPHGLGVAPELVIYKTRNTDGSHWNVLTTVIDGSTDYLIMNTTAAKGDVSSTYGGVASSTITNFGFTGDPQMLAYCFVSKPGYSKMGVYLGNGRVDGTMVNLGFTPAWVMIKDALGTGNQWIIMDTTRDPDNEIGKYLKPNSNTAEEDYDRIDFLSNGFKIRHNYGADNTNGRTYLYMAFAEAPFKYANAR